MQLAARWVVLVAALAGAAVLNLNVDDAMLSLEADDRQPRQWKVCAKTAHE